MVKILIVSDNGVPSGFGRIADEVGTRLQARGFDITAASYAYDGLLPPMLDGKRLPYHVASLNGKANWIDDVMKLMNAIQPEIVISIQDFPYAQQIRLAPVDWSKFGFMVITPVDGVPIFPAWLETMAQADGGLTISQFGVNAFREAGINVGLCRPGVDVDSFYRMSDGERRDLRAALGIEAEAFVFGTMAQNQGRKAIPLMMRAFFEFTKDKPNARYLMDMEPQSPAGWDLRALCEQQGWDSSKLIFRYQALQAGLVELRERYNVLDVHAVISHREGYGLPLAEAMACGVVSMALDYCSGPEVVGEGRGALVKCIDYDVPGTWGGAEDRYPDLQDMARKLQALHDYPNARRALALRGMAWARRQTWDAATDNVVDRLDQVLDKQRQRRERRAQAMQAQHVPTAAVPISVDGTQPPSQTPIPALPRKQGKETEEAIELVEAGV